MCYLRSPRGQVTWGSVCPSLLDHSGRPGMGTSDNPGKGGDDKAALCSFGKVSQEVKECVLMWEKSQDVLDLSSPGEEQMSRVSGGFRWDFTSSEPVALQTLNSWTKLQGPVPWAGTSSSLGEGGADTQGGWSPVLLEGRGDAGGVGTRPRGREAEAWRPSPFVHCFRRVTLTHGGRGTQWGLC